MKNSSTAENMYRSLSESDPQIAAAIDNESRRQHDGLELIASENFVSAVSAWEIVTKWRSDKEPRFVPMAVPILRATMRHA